MADDRPEVERLRERVETLEQHLVTMVGSTAEALRAFAAQRAAAGDQSPADLIAAATEAIEAREGLEALARRRLETVEELTKEVDRLRRELLEAGRSVRASEAKASAEHLRCSGFADSMLELAKSIHKETHLGHPDAPAQVGLCPLAPCSQIWAAVNAARRA